MSIEMGGTVWPTWSDVRNELFTPEEIVASDRRVARIGKHIRARQEREKAINEALKHIAAERLAHYDPETVITQEEIDQEFGITSGILDATDDVELE